MNNIGLFNISFPVYHLGKDAPIFDNGVHYYLLGKDIHEPDAKVKILVVDDKNRKEPTLARRRLAMKSEGVELKNLKKAIFFISDLIKLTEGGTWFIDTEGTVFEYRKNTRVKLTFKEITTIIPIASGGAIVEVKGMAQRFKVLHTPRLDEVKAAGLLYYNGTYILYGLYDRVYDDTIKMI
ncbi:hypothetical protein UFOVP273_31 [uncultured Caudovirales phage]|uniref:Uncharacterized protein n=1 Tax=uncultured Caudovirales phage TaxID=2100421 RepID=A0A6J5LI13_9CAUD|nr:hypothetical protein UFOVP273_31 [uncultured Caudovirales phage]